MVRVLDAHKRFGKTDVLRGVSTEVRRGEVVVLIGPSGSGKTTLLRCINHLEVLDAGRIYVDGELVGYREKSVSGRSRSPTASTRSSSAWPRLKMVVNARYQIAATTRSSMMSKFVV